MSKLKRNIRSVNREASIFPAKIIAISGNRVTVRLARGGTIYRSLEAYGGPIALGLDVKIDMTTDTPYVLVPSGAPAIANAKQVPAPRLKMTKSPAVITGQILRYAGSFLVAGYPFSVSGMNECLGDCQTNDTIVYPTGVLEMDFELPATVTLNGFNYDTSIFWGTITLNSGCKVNDILFLKELNSSSHAYAIIGPTSGIATLKDVKGKAFNCGTGNAYGLYGRAGNITIDGGCVLVGESKSGSGWGVYQA